MYVYICIFIIFKRTLQTQELCTFAASVLLFLSICGFQNCLTPGPSRSRVCRQPSFACRVLKYHAPMNVSRGFLKIHKSINILLGVLDNLAYVEIHVSCM